MGDLVVTRIGTTPIKGLRMHERESVALDASGAVGDRDFALMDDAGKLVSVTTCGPLVRLRADWDPVTGVLVVSGAEREPVAVEVALGASVDVDFYGMAIRPGRRVAGPLDELFSRAAGRSLRLVKFDEPGAGSDANALTLLGSASVRELERRSGLGPIDSRRFRMLIEFRSEVDHVEDTWEDREIAVGTARIRVGKTVPRCAATTRDPDEGRRDAPIVKAIKAYRGITETGLGRGVPFGVYADTIRPGVVSVGDTLHLTSDPQEQPRVQGHRVLPQA